MLNTTYNNKMSITKTTIKRIDICGLYNFKNYSVRFYNNALILVGENGAGKTTILRIVYAVLSCNWDLLYNYPFDEVTVYFETDSINIPYSLIKDFFNGQDFDRLSYYLDREYGRRTSGAGIITAVIKMMQEKQSELGTIETRSKTLLSRSVSYLLNSDSARELLDITNKINQNFSAHILYLPTYRRIEEQLQKIYPDFITDTREKQKEILVPNNVTELAEFGMGDVKMLVKKELDTLRLSSQTSQSKLTLGYLGEILDKTYEETKSYKRIIELSDNEIEEVFSRIDSVILTSSRKKQLMQIIKKLSATKAKKYSVHEKILCHYFMQLWQFNQEIKKSENSIRSFEKTVNKYMVNNEIDYNSENYSCDVYNINATSSSGEKKKSKIDYQDLSSGEKQIVSLFSHLYLDKHDAVFVFIDEPELSLSVEWQKSILIDIVNSPMFVGIMATTHSPFVFDNELEEYVHGINEFVIEG